MDEKLLSIIERVKSLSKEYPEFRNEMERLFCKQTPSNVQSNEQISKLAEYLGLDVYVDNMDSIVDFSFIKEKRVRDKLESDNREMIRFRYGTRYHEILFDEYCRYAQFQVEMLFNYYYFQKDKDLKEIKEHIKRFNDRNFHEKIDRCISLPAIPFNNKIWAFANEFGKKDVVDTLDFISRVRNSISHRGPEEQEDSFLVSYQKRLQDYHIVLLDDDTIDFSNLKKNLLAMNLFESKIKGTPDYKNYLFYLWKKKQPYEDIKDVIQIVTDTIRAKIV